MIQYSFPFRRKVLLFLIASAVGFCILLKAVCEQYSDLLTNILSGEIKFLSENHVSISDVKIGPISGMRLFDVEIYENKGRPGKPVVSVKEVSLLPNPFLLVFGRIQILKISLKQPQIVAARGKDGIWSIEGLLPHSVPRIPLAGLYVKDGKVILYDNGDARLAQHTPAGVVPTLVVENINAAVRERFFCFPGVMRLSGFLKDGISGHLSNISIDGETGHSSAGRTVKFFVNSDGVSCAIANRYLGKAVEFREGRVGFNLFVEILPDNLIRCYGPVSLKDASVQVHKSGMAALRKIDCEVKIYAELNPRGDNINIKILQIRTGNSIVRAYGSIHRGRDKELELCVEVIRLPLALFPAIYGWRINDGLLDGSMSVNGTRTGLKVTGKCEVTGGNVTYSEFGEAALGDIFADITFTNEKLDILRMTGVSGKSRISLSGTLAATRSPEIDIAVSCNLSAEDIQKIFGFDPDLRNNSGSLRSPADFARVKPGYGVSLQGQLPVTASIRGNAKEVSFDVSVDLSGLGVKWKNVVLKPRGCNGIAGFKGSISSTRIKLDNLNLSLARMVLQAKDSVVRLDSMHQFAVNASVSADDLRDISQTVPHLNGRCAGGAQVSLCITGDMNKFNVIAEGQTQNVSISLNYGGRTVNANGTFRASCDVDLRDKAKPVIENGSYYVQKSGFTTAMARMPLDDLKCNFHMVDGQITLTGISCLAYGGSIEAKATIGHTGKTFPWELDLSGKDIRAEKMLSGIRGWTGQVSGCINCTVDVKSNGMSFSDARVKGTLEITGGTVAEIPLMESFGVATKVEALKKLEIPSGSCNFLISDNVLSIEEMNIRTRDADFVLTGTKVRIGENQIDGTLTVTVQKKVLSESADFRKLLVLLKDDRNPDIVLDFKMGGTLMVPRIQWLEGLLRRRVEDALGPDQREKLQEQISNALRGITLNTSSR
jgi:hypothetical protein